MAVVGHEEVGVKLSVVLRTRTVSLDFRIGGSYGGGVGRAPKAEQESGPSRFKGDDVGVVGRMVGMMDGHMDE